MSRKLIIRKYGVVTIMIRNSKKIKIKRRIYDSSNDKENNSDNTKEHRRKKRFIKPPKLSRTLDKRAFSELADEIPQFLKLTHKESFMITAADSRIGQRNEQQDSFFVTKTMPLSPFRLRRTFAVVCDGMGGLEAGDRASLTAVSMLKLAFDKLPTAKVDIPKFFSEMIDYIDCEINRWDDLKTDKGAGTTLVSVIIENRRLYWASVGDSSIFIYQQGKLKRITTSHNYKKILDKMVDGGVLSQEQAEHDPQKDALVSYLGMGGVTFREINSKPYVLRSGDILMLCSDGVTNTLSESDIAAVIKENSDDVYRCCKEINQSVSKKNNAMQDNSTVVIIQYAE
ncbi:MAG: serine/threonine-protein phosphatase [Clostridia bacterium]|nr:serine/threonine-protein phosphatase [Clostridia bacterium]